jgi:hypothetical protein
MLLDNFKNYLESIIRCGESMELAEEGVADLVYSAASRAN